MKIFNLFFLVLGRYLGKTKDISKESVNPLVKEFEKSQLLDEKIRKEFLRPITHKNFHDPNVPLYEPFKLTESQQDILLSH